jgi:excinuclease ABC subunit C
MIDPAIIASAPSSPGVYLMKGGDETVLYVGKAKDLRRRVRSYLTPGRDSRWHIRFLMERVAALEFIVTDTEKEALILENTLIKRYRPRYNFNLRDDKTYFSLRLDMAEEFPRLTVVRKVERDGARYFGPYSSAAAAREVLKELARIFPLRHYPLDVCRRRGRPCLFFQIRQCSAPCHGLISRDEYAALAYGAALFLAGKNSDLLRLYRDKMAEAASLHRYEDAARFRDLISSIQVTVEQQKMVTSGGDRDVLGYYRDGNLLELALLFVRGGKLIGSRTYTHAWEMDDAEGIASFLGEYYNRDVFIPEELLLPLPLDETAALAELLSEKRGARVAVMVPRRGIKAELVKLAGKNAAAAVQERHRSREGTEAVLAELRERLHLRRLPRRIECYDISNIQGELAVGSRVVFANGLPAKGEYRRYRIATVSGANDFAMMHEVLSRRFRPGEGTDTLPDLIVVDGGTGQLNVLTAVLRELGLDDIDTAGLAKGRTEQDMASASLVRSAERIFLPGRKNPVVLRQNAPPLLLLARIRDEAHRFAITYHRQLRGKGATASSLDQVPGVGEKRRKEILRHFGSLQRVHAASREELEQVQGMGKKRASAVWEHLHGKET